MEGNKLLEQKQANLKQALNREEGKYVPNMITAGLGTISWTGKRAVDVLADPEAYAQALTAVYSEMWMDATLLSGAKITERMQEVLDTIENKYGPDGTTLEHVQLAPMEKDEYPQLIEDPARFVAEVLVPRKYPKLFSDRAYAKEALKVYTEDKNYVATQLGPIADKVMEEKYGIRNMVDRRERIEPALDLIFDYFRGFSGTLTDLRRQPANVRTAMEKLWEVRCLPKLEKPFADPTRFAPQMAHIPAYLRPSQFAELYWPHQKAYIERVAAAGSKAYIVLEGRWEKIWHHFLELPKDSCILQIDDDDILKANAELGHHQIICGGLKCSDVRLKSFEEIKDDIKRVIDTCAPGGGFLFATDKSWIAPGDVNQTLIEAFNFAHEYSSK